MRFFKKNPEIAGTIFVCGKPFDDNTVVFGDEFAPFADPNTFPGMKPVLVECPMKEIDGIKKASLDQFERDRVAPQPRSAGPTTTANFHMEGDGAKIDLISPLRTAVAPNPVQEQPKAQEAPKGAVEKAMEKKEPLISEQFTAATLADQCPGLSASSAKKILERFKTRSELAAASNVDLRTAGVRANYFNKVRAWAKESEK